MVLYERGGKKENEVSYTSKERTDGDG